MITIIERLKKWTAAIETRLVPWVQTLLMRDEETGNVEIFFTGSACLFNRDLRLRSLNHGAAGPL